MNSNTTYAEARALHPALPEQVEVIDCTLRDGEQSPGVAFTVAEKVTLATALSRAGVSVLDAGFPASSGADREAMQAMRALRLRAKIAATARPLPGDVAAAAVACASEVFMFMPTSDFRLSQTLGVTRRQAELRLLAGVEDALGRELGVSVVFEDATRADPTWIASLIAEVTRRFAIERIVLADSAGVACPARIQKLFGALHARLGPSPVLCAHSHNDFGLAAANTLAAVAAGARAVTVTVNGIGERAGNADLAETIAGLTHLYGVEHGIDAAQLPSLGAKVEIMSGIHMSALKPVTGFNVFRHESGVHVDAMIKDSRSYEFLPSKWVGREPEYVFGKHSGASVICELLADAGYEQNDDLAKRLLAETKRIASARDRTGYERAYRMHVTTMRRLLAGVDPNHLLDMAEEELAPQSRTGT